MNLYHATSHAAAAAINAEGFLPSWRAELLGVEGVFFADRPLTEADGVAASAEVIFEIGIDGSIDDYELVYEVGPGEVGYREWCIPTALANTSPRRIVEGAAA